MTTQKGRQLRRVRRSAGTAEGVVARAEPALSQGGSVEPLLLLRASPFFAEAPEEELQKVTASLQRMEFGAGSAIIQEGEAGETCYLLASGEAGVVSTDLIGQEVTLAVFASGALFGEIALVKAIPRTATVWALSPVTTYMLPRAEFLRLEANCPEFRAQMRRHVELLERESFLRKASPFARLPAEAVRLLAGRLRLKRVASGARIIREGERGGMFYLVQSGRVEVSKSGRRLQTLGAGDYFGEVALLTAEPRSATVQAVEPTELLTLARSEFAAVVSEHAVVRGQFGEMVRLRVGRVLAQMGVTMTPAAVVEQRRPWFWAVVLAGVSAFLLLSGLAWMTQAAPFVLAAMLTGGVIGPISYVMYLAGSNILRHRPWTLWLTFLLAGCVSVPLAALVEDWAGLRGGDIGTALWVGLLEESVKLLAVVWIWRRSSSRFVFDGVIYGAAAGMGFAAFETTVYELRHVDELPVLLVTVAARALLSPFGHGTWTAIMGAALWHKKGSWSIGYAWLAAAFLVSVGLHGLWDWVFLPVEQHIIWLMGIGVVGVSILRTILGRATQEEVEAVLALNPELAQGGGQRFECHVDCRSCGQHAPSGAHYCARCGAVLRARKLIDVIGARHM